MHHLRDLKQKNQTALLKNLIIMQMPFIPFYLTLLNSPYGSESSQRKTQGDLMLGNRPHQNSSICGQLSLCVCVHAGTCFQSTCVLSVLALISQPKCLLTDPRKSDYCPGWTGHDGIAGQTCVPRREKRSIVGPR